MPASTDDDYYDGYKQGESDTREELEPWIEELKKEVADLEIQLNNYRNGIQDAVNEMTDTLYDLRDVL